MHTKERYQEKLGAQLKEWTAQIDELKTRTDMAAAETVAQSRRQLENLSAQRDAAQAKLDALRQSGDQNWEVLRPGLVRIWCELMSAMDAARAQFT
jgi:phage-related minor tail protein